MSFNLSSSHMDDFGPIHLTIPYMSNTSYMLNTSYMSNDTYDNPNDDTKKSYVFMIAFFPLFAAALFIIITFYLECVHFPIKKKINDCRSRYHPYFEQKKAPIVNNKLNKTYIEMLNKSNKVILKKSMSQYLDNVTDDCAICMEVITNKEYNSKHSVVPDCGHCFHKTCLNQWVSQQSSTGNVPNCPVCRGYIVRQSDMKAHTVINVSYDSDSDTFSLSDYD